MGIIGLEQEGAGKTGSLKRGEVCIYRPARKEGVRRYTARDAGRVVCYALEHESKEAVRKEVEKCLELDKECERERSLLRKILEIAEFIAAILVILSAISKLAKILAYLRRWLPAPIRKRLEGAIIRGETLEGEWKVIVEEAKELVVLKK